MQLPCQRILPNEWTMFYHQALYIRLLYIKSNDTKYKQKRYTEIFKMTFKKGYANQEKHSFIKMTSPYP